MAQKPKSPFDDIAKLLAKEGVKLTKKQVLDVKRYARGVGRTNYLDKNPTVRPLKTPAQKKVSSRLEGIEDRRQDKGARLYGDSDGPMSYFFSDKTLNKSQKRKINQGFNAEEKMGSANARKVQQTLGSGLKPPKKSPVKKAPVKKAAPKKK
jgi:hypothetical protein